MHSYFIIIFNIVSISNVTNSPIKLLTTFHGFMKLLHIMLKTQEACMWQGPGLLLIYVHYSYCLGGLLLPISDFLLDHGHTSEQRW